MHEDLIQQIRKRVAAPAAATDRVGVRRPTVGPRLTEQDIGTAERELGFRIPGLLKEIYTRIGSGGFGPGYGLLSLNAVTKGNQGHNAIELYRLYKRADPDDPAWIWPEGLLPICHLGSAVYSCVDCQAHGVPVIIFDPNVPADSWPPCFIPQGNTLESWLKAWVDGVDLWPEVAGNSRER
jgi:hypothetical protein